MPMWCAGVVAAAIAAAVLISIWRIALPLTPPGAICPAIYPPPAGCAGAARLLPAAVWSVLAGGAVVAALYLGRRGWWGAVAGAVITAAVGLAGFAATLYMRVFLFA